MCQGWNNIKNNKENKHNTISSFLAKRLKRKNIRRTKHQELLSKLASINLKDNLNSCSSNPKCNSIIRIMHRLSSNYCVDLKEGLVALRQLSQHRLNLPSSLRLIISLSHQRKLHNILHHTFLCLNNPYPRTTIIVVTLHLQAFSRGSNSRAVVVPLPAVLVINQIIRIQHQRNISKNLRTITNNCNNSQPLHANLIQLIIESNKPLATILQYSLTSLVISRINLKIIKITIIQIGSLLITKVSMEYPKIHIFRSSSNIHSSNDS